MGYAAHRYDSMFRATVQVLRGIWCNVGNGVRLSICFGFRLAKAWWLLFCCVFFPCIFRCRKENNRARRTGVWKLWSFFCGLGLKTATVTALCPNRKQLVIPRYIWEKQKNSREQPSLKLTVRPLKRVFCSKKNKNTKPAVKKTPGWHDEFFGLVIWNFGNKKTSVPWRLHPVGTSQQKSPNSLDKELTDVERLGMAEFLLEAGSYESTALWAGWWFHIYTPEILILASILDLRGLVWGPGLWWECEAFGMTIIYTTLFSWTGWELSNSQIHVYL